MRRSPEQFICLKLTFWLIVLQAGFQGNIFRILIGKIFYKIELIYHFRKCFRWHIEEFPHRYQNKPFILKWLLYSV